MKPTEIKAARLDTGTYGCNDTLVMGACTPAAVAWLEASFPEGVWFDDEDGTTWLDTGIALDPHRDVVVKEGDDEA